MYITYLPLIFFAVALNAGAQLFLKKGMHGIGYFDFTLSNLPTITVKALSNFYILGGLTCYVFSIGAWLMVLSRVEVSYAYPLLSVGYIVTAIAGYYFFQEPVTLTRLIGIAVIILGVYLVTKS